MCAQRGCGYLCVWHARLALTHLRILGLDIRAPRHQLVYLGSRGIQRRCVVEGGAAFAVVVVGAGLMRVKWAAAVGVGHCLGDEITHTRGASGGSTSPWSILAKTSSQFASFASRMKPACSRPPIGVSIRPLDAIDAGTKPTIVSIRPLSPKMCPFPSKGRPLLFYH